ncbi:pseudouridine synthase, partial [Caulobacter sp. D4A]
GAGKAAPQGAVRGNVTPARPAAKPAGFKGPRPTTGGKPAPRGPKR